MKTRSLFLILATAAAFLRSPVLAAEVTVTTATDGIGVSGSLRKAIQDAAAGDTIKFASGLAGQTIMLTSGYLLITKSLSIQGLGANRLAINGNANSRIFYVSLADATVNLSGLLITNGAGPFEFGGGILFEGSGTLNLDRCEIAGNHALAGAGLGTKGSGTTSTFLNLTDCSIVENTSSFGGGGAALERCTAKMLNCTISGNYNPFLDRDLVGGGIFANFANLDLENCTVARNKLESPGSDPSQVVGGGIYHDNGELKLRNTIIAGNEARFPPDIYGTVTSLGHNLIGIGDSLALAASDQVGIYAAPLDSKLGPLQDNGGPTRTCALLDDSPALNAGDDAGLPLFDQRGVGYLRKFGVHVDIGAFEVQPCGVPIVAITGPASSSVYPVNTPVTFTGTFDAAGGLHTAKWTIDGNVREGTVNEAGTVIDTFTFDGPGVYSVQLTVLNACGKSASADSVADQPAMVVIYDPSAGFVTGGGWITSPAGAYAENALLTGKANFAFVSKYKKGATVPTGETSFEFKVAALNFSSQSYDWLVVSGARAQYKGVGSVNGTSGFAFMLTAIDGQLKNGGGTDKFRIKIWNIATSLIVYDNNMGDSDSATPLAIGGGSIIIH